MNRIANIVRNTKETQIDLTLDLSGSKKIELNLGVPFFEHLLNSMTFHGGFGLVIKASGDIGTDPHHLVEDIGIVLGRAFKKIVTEFGPVKRFGSALIPMDDALSTVVIDVSNRPYLVFEGKFPQQFAGNFDITLLKEFLLGFANNAEINLHVILKYGENSHHMAEAAFKALGKALAAAYEALGKNETLKTTKGSF